MVRGAVVVRRFRWLTSNKTESIRHIHTSEWSQMHVYLMIMMAARIIMDGSYETHIAGHICSEFVLSCTDDIYSVQKDHCVCRKFTFRNTSMCVGERMRFNLIARGIRFSGCQPERTLMPEQSFVMSTMHTDGWMEVKWCERVLRVCLGVIAQSTQGCGCLHRTVTGCCNGEYEPSASLQRLAQMIWDAKLNSTPNINMIY